MNLKELELIIYDQGFNSLKLTSFESIFLKKHNKFIHKAKSEKDKIHRQALVIMAANDSDFKYYIE